MTQIFALILWYFSLRLVTLKYREKLFPINQSILLKIFIHQKW